MKLLKDLLGGIQIIRGNSIPRDASVTGISFDSRTVGEGEAFFALNNEKKYIDEAIKKGASVVFVEKNGFEGPCAVVENVRRAMAVFSANFYGNPQKKLHFIGITGTNGKTTTAHIIKHILESNGKKTAIIGTLGANIDNETIITDLTTPDSPELFGILAAAVARKAQYIVMEVSAHAIYYEKTFGIYFDIGVFTNVSRDHLDFFGNMERYTKVKKNFFNSGNMKTCVLNIDDRIGRELLYETDTRVFTYGIKNPSDIFAVDVSYFGHTRFFVNCRDRTAWVKTPYLGEFNLYNVLAGILTTSVIGIEFEDIISCMETLPVVEGRMNVIDCGYKVIIDFAHTPDGLRKLLTAVREFTERRLITVFGCGGNRDGGKRAIMGKIASELSDLCVITSDNPRLEKPEDIVREIIAGCKKTGKNNFLSKIDRREAILFAMRLCSEGDVLVVAGKGAENYMDVGGKKIPFSDRAICEEGAEIKS